MCAFDVLSRKRKYLKELRHGILSCFVGSLKIVINWREPLNDSLPV